MAVQVEAPVISTSDWVCCHTVYIVLFDMYRQKRRIAYLSSVVMKRNIRTIEGFSLGSISPNRYMQNIGLLHGQCVFMMDSWKALSQRPSTHHFWCFLPVFESVV